MTGGGPTEVHILYPQKPNFRIFVLPPPQKKIPQKTFTYVFSIPKNSHTSSKLRYNLYASYTFVCLSLPLMFSRQASEILSVAQVI